MYPLHKSAARVALETASDSVPYRLRSDASTGRAAGATIYCPETGRFLFVKRSDTGDAPNVWACLGGGVDPGETIMQAIKREFMEEGQVDTDNFMLYPFYRFDSPGFSYYNFLGVCHEEFDPVLNHEHTEFRWSAAPPTPLHPNFEKALRDPRFRQVLDKARAEYLEEDYGIAHDYVSADQELRAEFYDSPQGRYFASIGQNTQDPRYTSGMIGGIDNSDFGSGLEPRDIHTIDASTGPGQRLDDAFNQMHESTTGNMVSSFGFGGGAAGEVHELGADLDNIRPTAPLGGYLASTPTQVEAGPTYEAFKGWAKAKQNEYLKEHPDSSFADRLRHLAFGKTNQRKEYDKGVVELKEISKHLSKEKDPDVRKQLEDHVENIRQKIGQRSELNTLSRRTKAMRILHKQWKELAVQEKALLKKLSKKWFGSVKSPKLRETLKNKADAIGKQMDAIGDKISILRGNS